MAEWKGDEEEAEAYFECWDLIGDSETDAVPDLVQLLDRATEHAKEELNVEWRDRLENGQVFLALRRKLERAERERDQLVLDKLGDDQLRERDEARAEVERLVRERKDLRTQVANLIQTNADERDEARAGLEATAKKAGRKIDELILARHKDQDALENVRMLAKRLRRTDPENAAHLLRFCASVGMVDNILRDETSTNTLLTDCPTCAARYRRCVEEGWVAFTRCDDCKKAIDNPTS